MRGRTSNRFVNPVEPYDFESVGKLYEKIEAMSL